MLSQEENDLLTQTGPGTPGGDLMRRYWQPVAMATELPVGGAPLAVRLLGEDLALFRDELGRPGLLGIHCAHRGADISYGRIEDGGLRCLYHGWLYDIHGNCIDQPGEPEGSVFKDKVHQTAYPCQEKAGLIFAYLGPGEPPMIPAYEALEVPDEHRLEKAEGIKAPLSCLTQARYGISWGAIGAAMACYEEVVDYTKERKVQGGWLAAKQLTQEKLVMMLTEITKA